MYAGSMYSPALKSTWVWDTISLSLQAYSDSFLALRLRQRHRGHGWSYCCPQGFHKELQVLRSESWNHHSINVLDILGAWSLADLRDVAWFATVEAETMMRVSLHQMGAIQVHRLGG